MGTVKGEEKKDEKALKEEKPEVARLKAMMMNETPKNVTDDQEPTADDSQQALRAPDETLELEEIEATNVTICAPQVLHFARDGSPLWFNGWILNNKFDKKHAKAGEFEVFMREPKEITEPEAWKLGEHNMCCLTGVHTTVFNEEEKETLKMIVDIARDVGAYDKN